MAKRSATDEGPYCDRCGKRPPVGAFDVDGTIGKYCRQCVDVIEGSGRDVTADQDTVIDVTITAPPDAADLDSLAMRVREQLAGMGTTVNVTHSGAAKRSAPQADAGAGDRPADTNPPKTRRRTSDASRKRTPRASAQHTADDTATVKAR